VRRPPPIAVTAQFLHSFALNIRDQSTCPAGSTAAECTPQIVSCTARHPSHTATHSGDMPSRAPATFIPTWWRTSPIHRIQATHLRHHANHPPTLFPTPPSINPLRGSPLSTCPPSLPEPTALPAVDATPRNPGAPARPGHAETLVSEAGFDRGDPVCLLPQLLCAGGRRRADRCALRGAISQARHGVSNGTPLCGPPHALLPRRACRGVGFRDTWPRCFRRSGTFGGSTLPYGERSLVSCAR
jgi:hypothetical protein